MSLFARLFGPCALGHQEPIKVLHGTTLHLECSRCQQDFGAVLPGQVYRARKVKKAKKVKQVAQPSRLLPMVGRKFRA